MPLVFVHGVSVRRDGVGGEYDQSERVRDVYFRGVALQHVVSNPAKVLIENPYWGDDAAKFYWNYAFLPDGAAERFGPADSKVDECLAEIAQDTQSERGRFLVTLARRSLARAVDCLWTAAAFTASDRPESGAALAELAGKALAYAEAEPNPPWLAKVVDDDDFAENLLAALDRWRPPAAATVEKFGVREVWDRVKRTVANVTQAAGRMVHSAGVNVATQLKQEGAALGRAINPLATMLPGPFYRRFGLFLGDVFKYLQTRGDAGHEGPIVRIVADAFRRAAKARQNGDDRLVIVGHSMGGNIAYDLLTHFLPEIQCDLFVTVGSQVGLFEELKLFHASSPSIPSAAAKKVARPANIARWLNVYDPADVFAYRLDPIFDGVKDYQFSTETTALSAHTMYFYRQIFHQRLNAHLREVAA